MPSQRELLSYFKTSRIIPVFYHDDAEIAKRILDISYECGIRAFEFTNRGENAFSVFTQLVKHIRQYNDYTLGIGTILNDQSTKQFIDTGADFIVSPIMKESMAEVCKKHDRLWVPGCFTVTEIARAKEVGASLIKIFPASALGPAFVSAIKPVLPDVQLMPTGGIEPTAEFLQPWFKAGIVCAGIGSQLFNKQHLADRNWQALKVQLQKIMDDVRSIAQH